MERAVAHEWDLVRANHARLAELHGGREPGVRLVNSHDPVLLQQAQQAAGGRHVRRA
jgi:hypothetical protein